MEDVNKVFQELYPDFPHKISVLNFKLQQRTYDSDFTIPRSSCLRNSLKISGPSIGLHTIILGMDEPRWTLLGQSRLSESAPYWEKVWVNIYPEKSRDWLSSSAQGFPSMGPEDTGSDRRVCFPNLIWPCQTLPVPGHSRCHHHLCFSLKSPRRRGLITKLARSSLAFLPPVANYKEQHRVDVRKTEKILA